MFVLIKMLPFRIAPYISCLLLVSAAGYVAGQETVLPTTTEEIPEIPLLNTDYDSVDAQVSSCPVDQISFELVTGFVYSAPADMLDSQPGTLMLTDCIDMCRRNKSCMSVNYETGLCVLFASSADMYPGSLTSSQFPVFTLYVQKTCLKNSQLCARSWSFERVMGFNLESFVRKRKVVSSRQECAELCFDETEFPCRSANYNNSTGECETSDMDRHTAVGSKSFKPTPNSEFLESNCVDDPVRLCEFQKMEGRILKTVDSVFQEVESLDDCKKLCLTAAFRCHSFDFGDTGDKVCRLSHHAVSTLLHIEEPYLDITGASTYELSSCYNVTIDCRSGDMVAKIKTSKNFNGKIYAKGSPNTCVNDVSDTLEFELTMSYNDVNCNVRRETKARYSNEVIIQHHDMIVTSADLGLSVHCQYDLSNKSVSNEVDLSVTGDILPSLEEEMIVDSPNVVMKITDQAGEDVTSASVGDMLELRFVIIDMMSPYEIFVRDLVALDGGDEKMITLLDDRGCPTEMAIMRPLLKIDDTGKTLSASFDAFKFPTSDKVQFRALVTPCIPKCEPVHCQVMDFGGQMIDTESYGRKKRSPGNDTGRELEEAGRWKRAAVNDDQMIDTESYGRKKRSPGNDTGRELEEAGRWKRAAVNDDQMIDTESYGRKKRSPGNDTGRELEEAGRWKRAAVNDDQMIDTESYGRKKRSPGNDTGRELEEAGRWKRAAVNDDQMIDTESYGRKKRSPGNDTGRELEEAGRWKRAAVNDDQMIDTESYGRKKRSPGNDTGRELEEAGRWKRAAVNDDQMIDTESYGRKKRSPGNDTGRELEEAGRWKRAAVNDDQMIDTESYGRKKRSPGNDTGRELDEAGRWKRAAVNDIQGSMFGNHFIFDLETTDHQLRRERREAPIPDEMLVEQTIKIHDKFGFKAAAKRSQNKQNKEGSKKYHSGKSDDSEEFANGEEEFVLTEDVSGLCINTTGLILACSIFLVAQIILILVWTAIWQRRRNSKLDESLSHTTTTESLRQLYDSGYPRRV